MEETKRSSKSLYWILFFISLTAMVLLLIFLPEWFWISLPFTITFLAGAMDAL
ncbi:MAG: hypothetical protein K1X61_04825 [Chitinophagales bacterium]|nr:hypothetical protein [Chitinophagales bacterium]